MRNISLEDLLAAGAHFGHMTSNWDPNMQDYIFTEKNGVHIIDLYKTLEQLTKAVNFVTETVQNSGSILFVATKKTARQVVEEEADRCGMFHVTERWLGGTLTNDDSIQTIRLVISTISDAILEAKGVTQTEEVAESAE